MLESCLGNNNGVMRKFKISVDLIFLFLRSDLDVFSRLVPKILNHKSITKKEAQAIFRSTVEDILKEAKNSKSLGSKKISSIIKLYKDLKVNSRAKDIKLEEKKARNTN